MATNSPMLPSGRIEDITNHPHSDDSPPNKKDNTPGTNAELTTSSPDFHTDFPPTQEEIDNLNEEWLKHQQAKLMAAYHRR